MAERQNSVTHDPPPVGPGASSVQASAVRASARPRPRISRSAYGSTSQGFDSNIRRPSAPRPIHRVLPYPLNDDVFLKPRVDLIPGNSSLPYQQHRQSLKPRKSSDANTTTSITATTNSAEGGQGSQDTVRDALRDNSQEVDARADGTHRTRPSNRSTDAVAHMVLAGIHFLLTDKQVSFDSPNGITQIFDLVRKEALAQYSRPENSSVFGPGREEDIGSFGLTVVLPARHPSIFCWILIRHLSGESIFPLNARARTVLVDCCKPGEDFYDVLHAEACVWGLERLQARVLEEKYNPPREHGLDEREAQMQRTAQGLFSGYSSQRRLPWLVQEDEDTEDVMHLLAMPRHELNIGQMRLVRRFHASRRRVAAWLEALQQGSAPAKPSNSTYMITNGWRVGTMYYISNAVHHAPVIPDDEINEKVFVKEEDFVSDIPKSRKLRGVVYILKSEQNERWEQEKESEGIGQSVPSKSGGVMCFARQSVARYSCPEFSEIMEQSRRQGHLFHGCMQNIIGRHGLEVVYKPQLILVLRDPLWILSELLIVGYYQRGSLQITSHPSELMMKVLPENRWTAPLPCPFPDEQFINDETDVRSACRLECPHGSVVQSLIQFWLRNPVAFSPCNLSKFWYLPY